MVRLSEGEPHRAFEEYRIEHSRLCPGGGPFVPLNGGVLPRTLAESELFGYRRGAFSGARDDRAGLARKADGGTVIGLLYRRRRLAAEDSTVSRTKQLCSRLHDANQTDRRSSWRRSVFRRCRCTSRCS
jgi:hypothetical protein